VPHSGRMEKKQKGKPARKENDVVKAVEDVADKIRYQGIGLDDLGRKGGGNKSPLGHLRHDQRGKGSRRDQKKKGEK